MFDNPLRIDAHMIRDHIGGEADSALPGASTQILQCRPTTQILGNIVGIQ